MKISQPIIQLSDSDNVIQRLYIEAKIAAQYAYVPYSKFRVGAALLTDKNILVRGANIENASYGLTNCAERTAVFMSHMHDAGTPQIIVVYTPTEMLTSPCGACRQVLNEMNPDMEVHMICDGDMVHITTVAELLPFGFGPKNLNV